MKYAWLLFLGLAIYYAFKSMQKSKIINKKTAIKLTGMVIDNQIGTMGNGISIYYPVYEYELDGEKKQYVSECNQFKPIRIGTQTILYYDTIENKIVESASSIVNMVLAVLFAGVTVLLMNFGK